MILPRAFELIELLAFAGTYTDQPSAPPGSQFLDQIFAPVRVEIDSGSQPDVFVTKVEIGPPVIGELMAGIGDPRSNGIAWAPLKVLRDVNAAHYEQLPNRRFQIRCPGLRFLIFTPLVGFPLAIFPFFREPLDPLAHFSQYVRDYFPSVTTQVGGSIERGRWLELNEGTARLRVWAHQSRLYVDLRLADGPATGVAVKFKNGMFFGVRVSAAKGPAVPAVEDLSKISCRNNGAIKKTWALSSGGTARAISSQRNLIDHAGLIGAGTTLTPDLASIGALLDSVERL